MISKALENIRKHWLTTLPAVLVIAVVLSMFHGLLLVQARAEATLKTLEEKFTVTVYLKNSADPFEIGNLITGLEARRDVIPPVTHTTSEQAFELMSRGFGLDPSLLKKYEFSLPESLTIRPKSPDDASRIEKFLQTEAGHLLKDPLDTKDQQKSLTGQMLAFIHNVKNGTQRTLIFFIALFVIGGSFLFAGTVYIALTSRKIEMHIMKLVGASLRTIAAPYALEGVMLAAAAFLLHLVFVLLFPLEAGSARYQLNALAFELAAALLLGGSVSYATVRFHLK